MNKQELKKLVIVCGGTGGHFYPGLTIAKYLSESGKETLLFLSGKHTVSQSEIARSHSINSVIMSCYVPINLKGKLLFTLLLCKNIFRAIKYLKAFSPDAVLCMGSFASVSTAIAAKILNIPVFLHDGNARVGRANRLLSFIAKAMGLAFPPVNPDKIHCPYLYTGMPIREELIKKSETKSERNSDIKSFNAKYGIVFTADIPIILIIGGSQGAKIFNERVPAVLSVLEKKTRIRFQVVHLAGRGHQEKVMNAYSKLDNQYIVFESSDDMALLYSIADLTICRSGGSTIAELTLFGKYALLSPFPYAAENHQYDNAKFYISAGTAQIIPDKEWMTDKPVNILNELLPNYKKYRELGYQAKKLAKPDAVKQIVNLLNDSLQKISSSHKHN